MQILSEERWGLKRKDAEEKEVGSTSPIQHNRRSIESLKVKKQVPWVPAFDKLIKRRRPGSLRERVGTKSVEPDEREVPADV